MTPNGSFLILKKYWGQPSAQFFSSFSYGIKSTGSSSMVLPSKVILAAVVVEVPTDLMPVVFILNKTLSREAEELVNFSPVVP